MDGITHADHAELPLLGLRDRPGSCLAERQTFMRLMGPLRPRPCACQPVTHVPGLSLELETTNFVASCDPSPPSLISLFTFSAYSPKSILIRAGTNIRSLVVTSLVHSFLFRRSFLHSNYTPSFTTSKFVIASWLYTSDTRSLILTRLVFPELDYGSSGPTKYRTICSAISTRHCQRIVDSIWKLFRKRRYITLRLSFLPGSSRQRASPTTTGFR
jgi:hypothetical protein